MSSPAYFTCFADHRPALNISLRALMAVFGSYALAAFAAATFATQLPLARVDAVQASIMLGFIVYPLSVIWVFATATLLRAASGLLCAAALLQIWRWIGSAGGGA